MLKLKKTVRISRAIQESLEKCNHPTVVESFSKYILSGKDSAENLKVDTTPDDSNDETVVEPQEEEGIPFIVIKQLLNINPDLDLLEILKGSHIILDKPPQVKKSEKLLAILKECQDIVDKREYYRMTKGLTKDINTRFSDVRFTIGQVSSVFNVILSMAAVFTVVMYFGDQLGNLSIKVLIALFCSWIVGIAEGYFLFKDLLEIQDQEEKAHIGKL